MNEFLKEMFGVQRTHEVWYTDEDGHYVAVLNERMEAKRMSRSEAEAEVKRLERDERLTGIEILVDTDSETGIMVAAA